MPPAAKLPQMKTPERIVSLISSATEILYLLGLGERVVGVSHECDYPGQVANKPRLTRSLVEASAASLAIDEQVRSFAANQTALYEIDVERLAELAPDLIITQAQCDVCAVRYEDVVGAVRATPRLAGAEILRSTRARLPTSCRHHANWPGDRRRVARPPAHGRTWKPEWRRFRPALRACRPKSGVAWRAWNGSTPRCWPPIGCRK